MEKLRENEEMFEKTKQLDNNWKDLLSIVNKMKKTNDDEDKPPADDFDKLVNSMIFEPRGVPTEKLKTEEEVAKQEKERLEKLERDRLSRMRGDEPEDNKPKHKSAEELDDFFFAMDPVTEDDESNRVISYEINPESEQNGQDQEIEESGSESESEVSEKGQEIDVKEKRSESESESAESESSADEEEEDDLEDLKHDSSSDEEIEETRTKPDNVLKISETIQTIKENPKPSQQIYQEPKLTPEDTETLDKIPFTIQMPQQYEELLQMLTGKSTKIQDIIVERIIKTNHPQLLQVNRNKMLVLFAYLLQYINDLFTDIEPETAELHFKILEILMPHLYDLLKFNQFDASKCFQDVMKEKQETYKKRFKVFPKLDTIVYFKVAATLYPTSDYRHPIVTPMYVFINQILTHCRIKSKCDLTNGLFLCTLLLESQELSKRFLPSCMNFLYNVCYMGVRKSMADVMKPLPPLRKNPTFDSILVLQENVNDDFDLKVCGKDFVEEEIDEQFKLKSLNLAICLMQEFIELYADHTGVKYFIYPFLKVLSRLQDEEYFTIQVKENLENCVNFLEKLENEKKFVYPVQEKKHKMLRLMEPKLETVYSDRRLMYSSHQTGPKAEEKKLKRQVKREFKAAKRELRRDNEFVSKVQLKRRLERWVYRTALYLFFHSNFSNLPLLLVIVNVRIKSSAFSTKLQYNRVSLMLFKGQREGEISFKLVIVLILRI